MEINKLDEFSTERRVNRYAIESLVGTNIESGFPLRSGRLNLLSQETISAVSDFLKYVFQTINKIG